LIRQQSSADWDKGTQDVFERPKALLTAAPDICGYRFAPEKYRELESVWCQYHPQESVMDGLQRGIGPQ
jgi:hypothetical protein